MYAEVEVNEEVFEVEFEFIRGSAGDYMNPPEPHDLIIHSMIGEDGENCKEPQVWSYIEDEIYDRINNGDYD